MTWTSLGATTPCGCGSRAARQAPSSSTCTARRRAASTSTTCTSDRAVVASDWPRSTPYRFTLRSIALDAAALADRLEAPVFRVVGQSSGVAYAVATAAVLQDRVAALATGGGGSPFEPDIEGWERLSEDEQQGVKLIGTDVETAERLLSDADAGTFEMLELDDAAFVAAWA